MAFISTAKVLLIFGGVALVWKNGNLRQLLWADQRVHPALLLIYAVLTAFAASLLWSTAPAGEAMGAFLKYWKLLVIPITLALLVDRRQAVVAFYVYAAGQTFLMLGSWLLRLGLPVPWATSKLALTEFSVFSTYLDQGIMMAVFSALCWHLRAYLPSQKARAAAVLIAVLSMLEVLFVLKGRSGHTVAIVLLSLAIMWQLPARFRVVMAVLPFLVLACIALLSPTVAERLMKVRTEVAAFSHQKNMDIASPEASSSGIRLHLWSNAIESIAQHPLVGSGVGSWSDEFDRIEHARNLKAKPLTRLSNPHQEYLLWGVQLGVPGVILFLALLGSFVYASWRMEPPLVRAVHSTVAGLAVACLFNSSLFDALIGDFFCVTLALLFALGRAHAPEGDRGNAAGRWIAA
jgi:O-antigen ligase